MKQTIHLQNNFLHFFWKSKIYTSQLFANYSIVWLIILPIFQFFTSLGHCHWVRIAFEDQKDNCTFTVKYKGWLYLYFIRRLLVLINYSHCWSKCYCHLENDFVHNLTTRCVIEVIWKKSMIELFCKLFSDILLSLLKIKMA